MSNTKKIDWSYESLPRYIVDLHIWVVLTVVIAYLFEPVEDYIVIKQIVGLWLVSLLIWLLLRVIGFNIAKDKEKEKQDEVKKCAAQVELSRETQRTLMKYACANDLVLSEVVEEALQAYVKKYEHLLEKRDANSSA